MDKKKNKIPFTFTMDKEEREYLEARCKILGLNFTELLRTGASLYADFDPFFIGKLKDFCRKFKMKESLPIQNFTISWFGQRDGEEDIHGIKLEDRAIDELAFTEKGPITAERLYSVMRAVGASRYRWQEENMKLREENKELKQQLKKLKTREEK